MNKICTSIEQSKKLIELGLDVKTADMMWDDWRLIDEGWKLNVGYYPEIEQDYGRKCYPAWSLTALLGLLPKGFILMDAQSEADLYSVWVPGFNDSHFWKDNMVDATFEMVCWLKENNKI